ncbi:hypothetical protein Ahu01nite_089210 [Winogradskya humida]|uniref:Uncharacterized protein n=1 Tax=Winogradskya humida TaxID=113566 RepID=A0ABQ4A4P5_9ACTN|nr:hypothetical protein Ahu01nite_089210 [Actinoplanes humidus]
MQQEDGIALAGNLRIQVTVTDPQVGHPATLVSCVFAPTDGHKPDVASSAGLRQPGVTHLRV